MAISIKGGGGENVKPEVTEQATLLATLQQALDNIEPFDIETVVNQRLEEIMSAEY